MVNYNDILSKKRELSIEILDLMYPNQKFDDCVLNRSYSYEQCQNWY